MTKLWTVAAAVSMCLVAADVAGQPPAGQDTEAILLAELRLNYYEFSLPNIRSERNDRAVYLLRGIEDEDVEESDDARNYPIVYIGGSRRLRNALMELHNENMCVQEKARYYARVYRAAGKPPSSTPRRTTHPRRVGRRRFDQG